jgi:hypothetical protein
MWAAYVLAIFLYQVVLFTAVGFGFSCFCFKGTRNWNMRLVWAPYFGMTVLTVLSADLMYGWLPGRLASWVTVIVCAALSLFCTIYCSKKSLPISLSQSRLVEAVDTGFSGRNPFSITIDPFQ